MLHVTSPDFARETPSLKAMPYPSASIATISPTSCVPSVDSVSSTAVSPVGATVSRPAACVGRTAPADRSAAQAKDARALIAVIHNDHILVITCSDHRYPPIIRSGGALSSTFERHIHASVPECHIRLRSTAPPCWRPPPSPRPPGACAPTPRGRRAPDAPDPHPRPRPRRS